MNAHIRKYGVIVLQQNDERVWELDVQLEGYDRVLKRSVPHAPVLLISARDDPYYALEFTSRAGLQVFITQLQAYADEVWPV